MSTRCAGRLFTKGHGTHRGLLRFWNVEGTLGSGFGGAPAARLRLAAGSRKGRS